MSFILINLAVASLLLICADAELFSAMADMELLLEQEDNMVETIDRYIEAEKERLEELRKLSKSYVYNTQSLEAFSKEMSNPISAFLKLKHINGISSRLTVNRAESFVLNITAQRESGAIKYPDRDDMRGAAAALMRLQDTYKLRAVDIAHGKKEVFGSKTASGKLTSEDCLYLAKVAYEKKDWYHTVLWSDAALTLNEEEGEDSPTDKVEILDYYSYSVYQQGNLLRAYKAVKEMIDLDPSHTRARESLDYFAKELHQEGISPSGTVPPLANIREYPENPTYESLCRGQGKAILDEKKLHCYYKRNRPFLKIAPIKAELVHVKPRVWVFHEVLSDAEIEELKEISSPMLKRATVHHRETNEYKPANYRTSKSAWLDGEDYEVVDRINKRLDMMTDLDMSTAEELQLANYGIGGHYSEHYDMATPDDWESFEDHPERNRLATVLFYMTTTEAGGATVFINLRIAVFPQKGSALFWHNVKLNGDPDLRTKHAACPVLSGVKWVSNKWIHEGGQEFRYKCHRDRHAYI